MSDPRSKNKSPKIKESKAPHIQLQKQQSMKQPAPVVQQKVMRNTGRGR